MTTPSTELVTPETYQTGLEDLSQADLTIPRLRLVHKQALFEDSVTGVQLPKLVVVILGLVKQRTLFHHDVENDDHPMCKSWDNKIGFPNTEPKKPKLKFPLELAGFTPMDLTPAADGNVELSCMSCKLKDWNSHPTGDKPYCSEQFTLPLYYARSLEELQNAEYSSALISFQKSSLAPLKRYLSQFQSRQVGAYTAYTEIGLDQKSRGQTDYCVPNFKNLGPTPTDQYVDFSENYGAIRSFLTGPSARPPAKVDPNAQDASVGVGAVTASPQPAAPPVRPALGNPTTPIPVPVAQPAEANIVEAQVIASSPADDDELPF